MREEIAVRVRELCSKSRPILVVVCVLLLATTATAQLSGGFEYIQSHDVSQETDPFGIDYYDGEVYIVESFGEDVDVYDESFEYQRNITVPNLDFGITAIEIYEGDAYVLDAGNTIHQINLTDETVTNTHSLSDDPASIARVGGRWVGLGASSFENSTTVILYDDSFSNVGTETAGSPILDAHQPEGSNSTYAVGKNDVVYELNPDWTVANSSDIESGGFGNYHFITHTTDTWLITPDPNDDVILEFGSSFAEPETEPNLELDTRNLIPHNETVDYAVVDRAAGEDVTSQATVTSGNTSVITVDETEHTLTAVNDTNVSQVVNVTAEYDGRTVVKQITVASVTVENLRILPTWHRVGAVIGDDTMFIIIISSFMGILGTRLATSFAGISAIELTLVVGWIGGYLSLGMIMVSTMMCIFVGLNLAANIDYQVRR